jgi:hypothetical protein
MNKLQTINELDFGSGDAEAYKRPEKKAFLNKVFLKDDIEKLNEPDKYFLIGDKGTGKTALSIFMQNNDYCNTISRLKFIRETDYTKFVELKNAHSIVLSDYTTIWKVIILLLISEELKPCLSTNPIKSFFKFQNLKEAIDTYYEDAFDPEILDAIDLIENIDQLSFKIKDTGVNSSSKQTETKKEFKSSLLDIKNKFEDAFKTVRIQKNFNLFIDGIDIRPHMIDQASYIECIKGLTHATWELNQDFFSNLKGNGELNIKVCLLMRPDIFIRMGLQNTNNKIRDNAVLLDWRTNYENYENSKLYKLANNLLLENQNNISDSSLWEHYFSFSVLGKTPQHKDPSFIGFLRNSFYRPRDLVAFLQEMQEASKYTGNQEMFTLKNFEDARGNFSNYLLGEIKDYLTFYYDDSEYELFLKFFQYLKGSVSFNYDEYENSFKQFKAYINKNITTPPEFVDTADNFLQFLYELNIISYVEVTQKNKFFHWCFRERSYGNLAPKVEFKSSYRIHPGLTKALSLGQKQR